MTKNKKDKQESNGKEPVNIEIKTEDIGDTDELNDINNPNNETGDENEKSRISELEEQLSKSRDQYLRIAAEFENYKRRTDSEKSEFFAYAGERLLNDLLPVIDDFERTMESFEKNHDNKALKKGIDLVYEKFHSTLAKQGLKPMESDGKKFDVNLHEAILQQPDEKKEPETILNTVEKGYYLKDKVLRHAKVVVSSKPE